jgi:citrate synthase
MQMLLEIGEVDKVDDYVTNILDTGGVIMGLGHAVYQVDDPRARILEPMSLTLGKTVRRHPLVRSVQGPGDQGQGRL